MESIEKLLKDDTIQGIIKLAEQYELNKVILNRRTLFQKIKRRDR